MTKRRMISFAAGVVALGGFTFMIGGTGSPDGVAQAIVERCAEKGGDTAQCYEAEVPVLLNSRPFSEVFSVVRALRREDSSYQFCHVLAHKLGERVVAEDPERWLDAIALNPRDGLCSNGFIHGVIGGKFRAEVLDGATLEALVPDFSRACEPRENWRASFLDQAICYHGMGHLYVFITDADMLDALSLCERTSVSGTGDFRRVCREGVFMQIFQPLEPDDFLMIERMAVKPTKETVREYCAVFEEDAYEGACLRESWPYVRKELLRTPGAIDAFCEGQPNTEEEQACYDTALSVLGRQTLGNGEGARLMCAALGGGRREECFGRVALSYLEEDRRAGEPALAFCEGADSADRDSCVSFLAERASFVFGEDELLLWRFCSRMPGDVRTLCMKNTEESTPLSGIVHTQ